MDLVLAKVKRLKKKPYKKLLSDTTLYPELDRTSLSLVNYNPDHNLDEDSWFKIDNFSSASFFIEELKGPIDSKNYDDLSREKFTDISCILGIQSNDIYFQKVTPSSFIRRKMIQFGEAAKLEDSVDRIVVKSTPDAVYYPSDDILLFRDMASVSSIFRGIDQLYKEATEAEVKSFLASDFIKLSGDYGHKSVSKPNRKRLALVSNTLATMSDEQRDNLVGYIKDYCQDAVKLTSDGKSFELSMDNQLKLILYGIEERFYTTQHSQEKRLANSIEPLS